MYARIARSSLILGGGDLGVVPAGGSDILDVIMSNRRDVIMYTEDVAPAPSCKKHLKGTFL